MNRVAPSHMASLIMGCWCFASATGNFVAGMIARATGSEAASGSDAAQEVVLEVYSKIGRIAIAVCVDLLFISPLIQKLKHLYTLKEEDKMPDAEAERAEPAGASLSNEGDRQGSRQPHRHEPQEDGQDRLERVHQ